jgi:hypothetical protein
MIDIFLKLDQNRVYLKGKLDMTNLMDPKKEQLEDIGFN